MATDLAPYEFLQIVKESAYGVPKTTPVAGVDSIYVRLAGANRFQMRPTPTKRKVGFGGGFAAKGYAVSDQVTVAGSLELELCYSQAQILLDWAVTRINAGQTTPWVTTEPIADLASCSVFHGIARDDGTVKRRQYKGVKVHNWKLSSNAQNGLSMLTMGLQAQKYDGNTQDATTDPTSVAFPAPADTAFPTDPILFYQSTTTANSSVLNYVRGIDLNVTNGMDPNFFESYFISFDRLRGRESTAALSLLYTATPDWRSKLEAIASEPLIFSWTNTTHTVTIDYKANNLVDQVTEDLTPGKVYNQAIVYESQWSPAASSDITFTYV